MLVATKFVANVEAKLIPMNKSKCVDDDEGLREER
jgi:hypothetical protein